MSSSTLSYPLTPRGVPGTFRLLPDSVTTKPQGVAAALNGVRCTKEAPPLADNPIKLHDAGLRLRRTDLVQVLSAMKEAIECQAKPGHSSYPRWIQSLRALAHRFTIKPEPAVMISQLRKTLQASADRPELDVKECARFSLEMASLTHKLPRGGPLAELCQRLELLGKASWAQLAREEAEARLLPQFTHFNQPGNSHERRAGVSLGVGLGAGVTLSASVGLDGSRSMDNDDQGCVYQNQSVTTSLRGGVDGTVGVASLFAGGVASYQHTKATEYNSAQDFVKHKADQLVYASRRDTLTQGDGPHHPVAAWIKQHRPLIGSELRQYRQLLQQATDQQQRLGVLLGALGLHTSAEALPKAQAAYQPPISIRSYTGTASVRAEASNIRAGASLTAARVNIEAQALTPFYKGMRQGQDAARNPVIDEQRRAGISQIAGEQMGTDMLKDPVGRLSTEQNLKKLRKAADDPQADIKTLLQLSQSSAVKNMDELRALPPDKLRGAADNLRAEFEHFCAVAQQLDAGHGKHQGGAAVERSILTAWRAKNREEALTNMTLAHAALTLVAADKNDEALLQQLDELAPQLFAPPIRHDVAKLAKYTNFHDVLRLQIRDNRVALDLGATLGPLGLKVAASLTDRIRLHHNPVRAGDYKDVQITLSGSLNSSVLDTLRDALSAQLAPHGLAADVPAALDSLLASSMDLQAGGALTLLLRFYRPQYQTQADFPAKAAGFRLQLTRVSASGNLGVSLSGDVPLQPGLSLKLGVNASSSATRVLSERWGSNSLSAPLMHYLHLKSVGESERWPALRQTQRPALENLYRQLAEPDSAVRQEAEYYLRRQGENGVAFFTTMENFANSSADFAQASKELEALMERQYPLWQVDKKAFSGWEALPLAR